MDWTWLTLFVVMLATNFRAALKLLIDWRGMLTTVRFEIGRASCRERVYVLV